MDDKLHLNFLWDDSSEDNSEDNSENENINGVNNTDFSYFNQICINIKNMTNSNINLGNNHIGPSATGDPSSSTPSTPNLPGRRNPITQPQQKRQTKKASKRRKPSIAINFPGMIQKNRIKYNSTRAKKLP